jgi:DNA-binding MarR family transcriptional regulator
LARVAPPGIAIIPDDVVGPGAGFDDRWERREHMPAEHGAVGKCDREHRQSEHHHHGEETAPVLLELARAGGRLRVGELGERLVVEPHNITRLLDRLEAAGLLKRQRAPKDRRGVFAVLTEKGAALRKQMWLHYRSAILEVLGSAVSKHEAETLTTTLKKIIAHLRKQH